MITLSPAAEAYRITRETFDRNVTAWNRMTPEQRQGCPDDQRPDNRKVQAAAKAFAADAAGRHKIEESAKVYLVLGTDGWQVDLASDGDSLEGYEDGALNSVCEHPEGDDLDAECELLRLAADYIWKPNAAELRSLLNEAL